MPVPNYNYSMELDLSGGNIDLSYKPIDLLKLHYPGENNTTPTYCKFFKNKEGSDQLPAGTYTLRYKSGAIKYAYEDTWRVNCVNPTTINFNEVDNHYAGLGYYFDPDPNYPTTVGFVVCFTPLDTVGKLMCPGTYIEKVTDSEVVSDSLSDTITFAHNGGKIGIYFHAEEGSPSSSSAGDSTYAEESSNYGTPQFILIRGPSPSNPDESDPADYDVQDPITIKHAKTDGTTKFFVHTKRLGAGIGQLNSWTAKATITKAAAANTSGTITIKYDGNTILAPTTFSDLNNSIVVESSQLPLPASLPNRTLEDETIEVIITASNNNYDSLNWNISFDTFYLNFKSTPLSASNLAVTNIYRSSASCEFDRATETGTQNLILGYDIYFKDDYGNIITAKQLKYTSFTPGGHEEFIATLDPGSYYMSVQSYDSYQTGSEISLIDSINISQNEFTYGVCRNNPQEISASIFKIGNHVKLIWKQVSTEVNGFVIYRAVVSYVAGVKTATWKKIMFIEKTDPTNQEFNIVFDLEKDVDAVGGVVSYSGLNAPDFTDINTGDLAAITQDILRKIFLNIDHYELYFRISATSIKDFSGSTNYILVGKTTNEYMNDEDEGEDYYTSLTSTKTQMLIDKLNIGETADNSFRKEFEPVWGPSLVPYPIGTASNALHDASRTAIDTHSGDREPSGWVCYRQTLRVGGRPVRQDKDGAVIRYNLATGVARQVWYNTGGSNAAVNPWISIPRGIVIDPSTGDALVGGINPSGYLCRLKYKSSHIGTESIDLYNIEPPNAGANAEMIFSASPYPSRDYGSVYDKHQRIWMISGNHTGYVDMKVGSPTYQQYVSYAGLPGVTNYGICLDFFGNIWISCGWGDDIGGGHIVRGKIYRIAIDPNTGAIGALTTCVIASEPTILTGITCDAPDYYNNDYSYFRIWVSGYSDKKMYKVLIWQHRSSNTIVQGATNSVYYGHLTNDIPVHGVGISLPENDVLGVTHNEGDGKYMVKIYQKDNNDTYPRGGYCRYNNREYNINNGTWTGNIRYTDPVSTFMDDDRCHPMWHPCYDVYDTNFSFDLNTYNRYICWKKLSNENNQNIQGYRIYEYFHNTTSFTTRYTNETHPATVVSGLLKDNANQEVYVSIFSFNDYYSWESYIYSDFTGGMSAFNNYQYQILSRVVKYDPIICKTSVS